MHSVFRNTEKKLLYSAINTKDYRSNFSIVISYLPKTKIAGTSKVISLLLKHAMQILNEEFFIIDYFYTKEFKFLRTSIVVKVRKTIRNIQRMSNGAIKIIRF